MIRDLRIAVSEQSEKNSALLFKPFHFYYLQFPLQKKNSRVGNGYRNSCFAAPCRYGKY